MSVADLKIWAAGGQELVNRVIILTVPASMATIFYFCRYECTVGSHSFTAWSKEYIGIGRCVFWKKKMLIFLYAHCKDTILKIWIKYSQERNCTATVPNPTFMFLWAIYIFCCLFCCRKIGAPNVGIYRSLTDTWMWKLGLRSRNSFPGNS